MNMSITIDWTFEEVDAPHTLDMGGTTRAGGKLRLTINLAAQHAGTLVDVNATVDGGMIDGPYDTMSTLPRLPARSESSATTRP